MHIHVCVQSRRDGSTTRVQRRETRKDRGVFFRLRAPEIVQQRGGGVTDHTDTALKHRLILKNGPSQLAFSVCGVLSSGSKAASNPLFDK